MTVGEQPARKPLIYGLDVMPLLLAAFILATVWLLTIQSAPFETWKILLALLCVGSISMCVFPAVEIARLDPTNPGSLGLT